MLLHYVSECSDVMLHADSDDQSPIIPGPEFFGIDL